MSDWDLAFLRRRALEWQVQGVAQSQEVCDVLNGVAPKTGSTKAGGRNKFGAIKTPVLVRTEDGGVVERVADSKVEAERWGELVLLEQAGVIAQLRFHPVFLLPGGVKYEADSSYTEGGKRVVEDVKGVTLNKKTGKKTGTITATFRNKWKQMAERYPELVLRIEER